MKVILTVLELERLARKVNRMSKELGGFGFQFRVRAEEMAVRGKASHTDQGWTVGDCEYL